MTSKFTTLLVTAAFLAIPHFALAQQSPPGPPVRSLPEAIARSTTPLSSPTQVRALSNGSVLVNDGVRRQLLLLDSTLALVKIVADSAIGAENGYGIRAGRLMPYLADSSLLIDGGSLSMLVIDERGEIAKIKAVPRTEHVTYLSSTSTAYGEPGLDALGRLIYKINDPSRIVRVADGGGIAVPEQPDSGVVLRLDLDSRVLDTAAMIRIPKRYTTVVQTSTGGYSTRSQTNPMPVVDNWAVTSDGLVALLRHRDYHIDWLLPDGSVKSSPPMPFDWQRLTDEHKKAFVDSVKAGMEESNQRMMSMYDSINVHCFNMAPLFPTTAPRNAVAAAAAAGTSGGAAGTPPAASTRPANCPTSPMPTELMMSSTSVNVVPARELPDYKPPFAANSMRADADGNVWIRVNQMKPIAGHLLYDIANREGELFDRIQIPTAKSIVGFGPGGYVYLMTRGPGGSTIEKVKWRQ